MKNDETKFATIMYTCLHGIHAIATLLRPFLFLPDAGDKIQRILGQPVCERMPSSFPKIAFHLFDPEPLFSRMEVDK